MKGYIGLLSVLFVGAVGSVIAAGVILLGLASSRTSFALVQSEQAKALANACAEEALLQIRLFLPYTGVGTLTMDAGSCDYSVTTSGGQNRTVSARGFVGSVMRKVSISVTQIVPSLTASWQEIP